MHQQTHIESSANIFTERVSILHKSLPMVIAVSLLASFLLAYPLTDVIPRQHLTIWILLVATLSILRFANYISYKHQQTPRNTKLYATYFTIGSLSSGILWGCAGFLFFPEQSMEHQFFILILFAGMGTASMASSHAYLPVFYAYIIPLFLPLASKALSLGDAIHLSVGFMVLAFMLGLSYFGFTMNRSLVQSLRLRLENIDLVNQLREQKNEAEQANTAKSKFLAAASHDLRQPLHALSLFTSALDQIDNNPRTQKIVTQINGSVDALQSLFNALLDISRLDAGVMNIEKRCFDLQLIFKRLANDFNPPALDKGLSIYWPKESYIANTDPSLLEQILRNFISNAIRYTDKGKIKITCTTDDTEIVISVSDTGIGIPKPDQARIFEEFQQLTNPERDRNKGLGLGLAIVKRTAELINHPVSVESTPGKGSSFSIRVSKGKETKIFTDSEPEQHDYNFLTPSALVLVIDDEHSVREAMKSLLETWSYETLTAADADEAIKLLIQQDQVPDVLIADYRLRENRSGIEAATLIQQQFGHTIPTLIVTGDIAVDKLQEVNTSGFQILHKPVPPVKIRAFLHNALKKFKQGET